MSNCQKKWQKPCSEFNQHCWLNDCQFFKELAVIHITDLTAIKLRIFPFALSLSKGEWKNPKPQVKPFMLRQAQHERLNLMAVTTDPGSFYDYAQFFRDT
jgi:hypothetical protein